MRITHWATGALVAAVLAGTTGCGGAEVTVRPSGGSSSGSACVTDGAGSRVCADDAALRADAPTAGAGAGSGGPQVGGGSGAGVSIGPDGVSVTDGQGNGATVGPDGVSAGAAPDPAGPVGSGGTSGTVELGGALRWRGEVSGGCNQLGSSTRVIAAELPDSGVLQVQIYDADTASVAIVQGERAWGADFLGNGAEFITVRDGSTQLRGVRLAGESGTVDLTATFDC